MLHSRLQCFHSNSSPCLPQSKPRSSPCQAPVSLSPAHVRLKLFELDAQQRWVFHLSGPRPKGPGWSGEEARGRGEPRGGGQGSSAGPSHGAGGLELSEAGVPTFRVWFLQVQQCREGESFNRALWSTQTASDSWLISSIDLQNSTEPYRIAIDGRPGESTGSSVAIFEIRIKPGYCLECDYEESHLCGYSNQWNTNVNWYRGGGAARDPHNNLPDDHTQSNGAGHYMYVDSVYAKTFQEVAKLVSAMSTVPMSGCLSLQYQWSEDRGNLFSVYTRDQASQYQELWRADPEDQNLNNWTVTFNSPRGGRVALDDIAFSPEFCSAETEPTFDPSIANCDFEVGFCRYTQDQMEGSTWKRVSVKPNIYRTGDHTTGAGERLYNFDHQEMLEAQ
ncbi:hypothetical protein J4Q44_G00135440 [Coregonus suidteri]|uniref:MAM domain-containing protein n=1 Tax=Coregonus suidteri TaxID=861788 RepID=A0AAN8LPB8_9TELE